MSVDVRPVIWEADTRERVREFCAAVRQDLGYQLELIQRGLEPSDWKPLTTVGPGVRELRIRRRGAVRVIYWTRRKTGVHVLHAFEKKTRKTPLAAIDLARERYRGLIARLGEEE